MKKTLESFNSVCEKKNRTITVFEYSSRGSVPFEWYISENESIEYLKFYRWGESDKDLGGISIGGNQESQVFGF